MRTLVIDQYTRVQITRLFNSFNSAITVCANNLVGIKARSKDDILLYEHEFMEGVYGMFIKNNLRGEPRYVIIEESSPFFNAFDRIDLPLYPVFTIATTLSSTSIYNNLQRYFAIINNNTAYYTNYYYDQPIDIP
jgi:hypothetical protein